MNNLLSSRPPYLSIVALLMVSSNAGAHEAVFKNVSPTHSKVRLMEAALGR